MKYMVNREGVLSDPDSFSLLSDFGHDAEETTAAVTSAVQYLLQQLYGNNLILLLTPDMKGDLHIDHMASTLPLNGRDATILEKERAIGARGIPGRAFFRNRDELISDQLTKDQDYLEFSKETRAVYAVPIKSRGRALGVLSIDSSDPRNFSDTHIMPFIHNFIELLVISLLNDDEKGKAWAALKSRTVLTELERDRMKAENARALEAGWPLSPALLQMLLRNPLPLYELEKSFPGERLGLALLALTRADLVEYRRPLYALTSEGERLASTLDRLISPPSP